MKNIVIKWKSIDWIPGFENCYEVSNTGLVKSKERWVWVTGRKVLRRERILLPFFSRRYRCVKLCANGVEKSVLVHRLVAIAFVPNPENKPEVNHIDGNPSNNFANNLEWVTRDENMRHAVETGLMHSGKRGADSPRSRKVAMYDLQGDLLTIFDSVIDAARFFGGESGAHISAVCNRKRYTSFCHIFRYVDDNGAVETKLSPIDLCLPHQSLDQIYREDYDTFRSAGAALKSSKI